MQAHLINDPLYQDLIPDNSQEQHTDPKFSLDREIIVNLKNGDHKAFDTVFHTFYARIKSFVRILTKDPDMCDELSQEVFVNLWLYRESVDPDKNFNAYIYTIARNTTMRALKAKQLHDLNIDDYGEEMDTTLTDDELIAKETELLVRLTVSRMPAKRRRVYEMSRYEYKSNAEIAEELKISKKVVERHLRLALTELREVIGILLLFFYINKP